MRATIRTSHFGAIFHQNPMNKSMRKSMTKKWWKLMNNRYENWYTFSYFSKHTFIKKRIFRKRLMCVNHMNPRVKHVSARVRPKIRKSENEKNCTNNIQKMKRKLVCWKHEKSSKISSKMEPKTMKKPSQNQCRNLMRKRESSPDSAEPSPGPGGNYKSTRLPVGNLHKNRINK